MSAVRSVPVEIPVDPDAPEARDWIVRELSDPAYEAARPNWFDELVRGIVEWLNSLTFDAGAGGFPWWILVGLLIVAGIVVAAYVVYGAPRAGRRSSVGEAMFGADEERDAATIRRDAERAAAAGDFSTAIVEAYRALARGLSERTLVSVFPGTTAHGFATRASGVFPDAATRLDAAAATFDGVRYLGRRGTAEEWERMRALEAELRDRRPTSLPAPPVAGQIGGRPA